MADISVPNPDFVAGTTIQSGQVDANNQRLVDGLNLAVDSGMATMAGLSVDGGTVRRGKSIIATEESRTNTAYGTLTTPDQVANVVLPTDGLIVVGYQALWKNTTFTTASAAIFVGSNQLKVKRNSVSAPAIEECAVAAIAANYAPLGSFQAGLASGDGLAAAGSDVTTGQAIGIAPDAGGVGASYIVGTTSMPITNMFFGGPCYIFAAAGTYTIAVMFKASSGSVTAKERRLWVWTIGFT